jgi:ABC-type Zn2+ transport system substrate-binding protein/surface adhesin
VITISNDTYEDAKSAFNDFLNAENKAMSQILDLMNKKTDWVSYDAFSDFEKLYGINLDIGSEYDYRSIIDYFKIIVS